jgi:ATP-dependent DNA ligase
LQQRHCSQGSEKSFGGSLGLLWLHEIKHDGFRIVARKDGDRVRIVCPAARRGTGTAAGAAVGYQ